MKKLRFKLLMWQRRTVTINEFIKFNPSAGQGNALILNTSLLAQERKVYGQDASCPYTFLSCALTQNFIPTFTPVHA